jgi:Ca2+-binding EF-hand superfamily protein
MARRTYSVTLGIAFAAGLCAAAQPAEAQRPRDMLYANWDRNGDGRITRDEWRGSRRGFEAADWNHDGVLSGDEVRSDRREPDRDPRGDDRLYQPADRGRGEPFDDWTPEAFRDLDTNRDGRLTSSEWAYDRDDFARADHNGDGVVTEREFLGEDDDAAPVRGGAIADDARFADLDSDRDNRVSRREWRGDRGSFDRLDENRDGYLTRAEMAEETASIDFRSLDLDHNGVITRGEWRESSASFSRLDRNRDGQLTADEFDERAGTVTSPAAPDRTPAYRAGYERGLADGRLAGREDRTRNQGWDLDGQRELEQADAGYHDGLGPRVEYQAGYRAAFRIGYTEGYGRR